MQRATIRRDYRTPDFGWSPAGAALAIAALLEIAAAVAIVLHGGAHRPLALVVAAAVAIGTVALLVRVRMPTVQRVLLSAGLCVTLFAMACPPDLFGIGAIRRSVAGVTGVAGAPTSVAEASPRPTLPANIVLRPAADAASARFAQDLSSTLAEDAAVRAATVPIDGLVDVSADADGPAYGLTWSIGALWCGRITATGQLRAEALLRFSRSIATALDRSTIDSPTCR